MKMQPSFTSKKTKSARLAWILPLLGAGALFASLAAIILNFPYAIEGIASDWNVTQAYPAVRTFSSPDQFAAYILVLRYLALLFILPAAATIIFFGRKHLPLVAAGMLIAVMPFFLGFSGDSIETRLPEPYKSIFSAINLFFVTVFLFGMLYLAHAYPEPAPEPSWLRKLAALAGGAVVIWTVLLFAGMLDALGDLGWFGFMLIFLANFILAALSFIFRIIRQGRQAFGSRGVAALIFLFVWLLATMFLSDIINDRPFFNLFQLHFDILGLVFIAGSFLADTRRENPWGIQIQPYRRVIAFSWTGFVLAAVTLGLLGAGQLQETQAAAEEKTGQLLEAPFGPLLVDTDVGNDDILALLYLMEHPGVELQAVTVVGTGLVHCEPGVKHVLGLLELTEYAGIPVSCGSEIPFGAEHEFPSDWREAADRLWGLHLGVGDRRPDPRSAPEIIAEYLRSAEEPANILVLGPFTNFAEVFQAEPGLLEKVGMLYMMGGAVETPGNVYDESLGFDNRTAEWNIYGDPVAARMVFETGVPITMIPLDATNDVPVDMALFSQFEQKNDTRVSTFVFNIFYINQGWIQSGFYYLWDTLAAAVMISPEVATFKDFNLAVVTDSGPDYGRTAIDPGGRPVRVAIQADPALFDALFVRVLRDSR